MGRQPRLPAELLRGPFTVEDARRSGLEPWHLQGASWRRVGPAAYVWAGLDDDPMHRLYAAAGRLPADAAFSGPTAAWLHGLDVPPCDPIEVTIPLGAGVSARAGMAVRRVALSRTEVVRVRGLPATSIIRTVCDLACRLSLVEGVVIVDAALHARRVGLDQLTAWAMSNRGRHGIGNLERVIHHAEPAAESPMESRLRMLLVLGGLPRPQAQVPIHDRWGRFVGRPDLYYEQHRLGIEYDGAVHRDSLAADNRRQNALLRAGVRLLRFTGGDVLGNPESVVRLVREATSAGKTRFRGTAKPTSAGKRGKSAGS